MSETETDSELILDPVNIVISIIPSNVSKTVTPCRTSSLSGHQYFLELMSPECNPNRFKQVLRIDRRLFVNLLETLELAGLSSSRNVCAGEKLMIFLYTITGKSNREVQERFQHSGGDHLPYNKIRYSACYSKYRKQLYPPTFI
jgi:hypothetical protein